MTPALFNDGSWSLVLIRVSSPTFRMCLNKLTISFSFSASVVDASAISLNKVKIVPSDGLSIAE